MLAQVEITVVEVKYNMAKPLPHNHNRNNFNTKLIVDTKNSGAMAPTGRGNAQKGYARREGVVAAAEAGETTATELRSNQSAENIQLKNENDALKKKIDILKGKLNSATSGADSSGDTTQEMYQKVLNEGQRASISAYVSSLFKRLKFLNNETLAAFPNVLQKALRQLVVVEKKDTQENYKTATLKEMRYQLSQKRQYSKKQIMKKYLGTKC